MLSAAGRTGRDTPSCLQAIAEKRLLEELQAMDLVRGSPVPRSAPQLITKKGGYLPGFRV